MFWGVCPLILKQFYDDDFPFEETGVCILAEQENKCARLN